MYKSFRIEGIVIKRKNFGEADKLLTIFTKNQGKIKVIAKGIRKIKSKKAPHLELFNQVSAFVYVGKTFNIITEAVTDQSFPNFRKDLDRLIYAYRIIEEIDSVCPEQEPHSDVFALLSQTLSNLNGGQYRPEQLAEIFTRKLLEMLGFLPRDRFMTGRELEGYLESIIERHLKSKRLLTRLSKTVS